MKINTPTRYATLAALIAGLACAGNKADQSAAAKDTTTTTGRDTLNGQNETPPGYSGMERDTTQAPTGQTPSDTFLENQGQGTPQDTAGYSGIERDTTGQANQQNQTDTTGVTGQDTSGAVGPDTSSMNQSSNPNSGSQLDSTGTSQTGDTTGYNPSQQSRDSTNR